MVKGPPMHGGKHGERSERAGEAAPTPGWTDERGSEEGSLVVKGPPMHGGKQ